MTTLIQAHNGLVDTLHAIDGFQAYKRVTAFNFPCAFVPLPLFDYRDDLDEGSYTVRYDVRVLGAASAEDPLDNILVHLDPDSDRSIYQAIMGSEAGNTLGGLDVTSLVLGVPRPLIYEEVAATHANGQVVQIQVMITRG